MENELPSVVGVLALAITVISAVLGFLFDKRSFQSAILLGGYAAAAGLICTLGALAGRWPGLLLAVVVVAILAFRVALGMGNKQGGFFAVGLWLGLCLSCAVGYWGGGWLGLLLITLPPWILFWAALFTIAHMLLPLNYRPAGKGLFAVPRGLRATEPAKEKARAFRSLITYSLGTNYPYLALEKDEMVERVKGKLSGRFLGGPGIVLTGPSHAPVIWTGTEFTPMSGPGLTFTERLERVYQTLDLRPQLRTFHVEAMTRDGIRVRAQVFCPFQLDAGGQVPALGRSFPWRTEAIEAAIQQQSVEKGKRVSWDEGVTAVAARILRNLLAEYTFDELAEAPEPWKEEQDKGQDSDAQSQEAAVDQAQELELTLDEFDPMIPGVPASRRDVRAEISARLASQLKKEIESRGVLVLGAGLGSLEPVDRSLMEKRVDAWRAHWERRILVTEGQTRGQEIDEMEAAYQRAQVDLLRPIVNTLKEHPGASTDLLSELVALRFVEALEEMARQPELQAAVPRSTTETLAHLRRTLGRE